LAWPLAGHGPLRPIGLMARRAGLPGRALAVRRLDSAAAGDGGARFAVRFMSCSPGAKSAVCDLPY